VGLLRSITRRVTLSNCECGETIEAPSSLAEADARDARWENAGDVVYFVDIESLVEKLHDRNVVFSRRSCV
jgi:hypothetical protein